MKSSIIIMLFIALCSTASFAETPSDNSMSERAKAKTVSRLYQATYGSSERCKKATPDANLEFQNELNHFVEVKANLMKLITQSPYYDSAVKQFSEFGAVDPERDTPEMLASECKYLALTLRSMIDTPEGKNAAKEFEDLLSK